MAYIETIKTSGTIVTRDFSLLGESIGKGESKKIIYQIVSPKADNENNYIILNLYNKSKEDYERIKISFGLWIRVDSGHYCEGFYRLSQKYAKNYTYLTFYDYDEPNIIKILTLELILHIKSNLIKQQKESNESIKAKSGLSKNEMSLIDFERYNF